MDSKEYRKIEKKHTLSQKMLNTKKITITSSKTDVRSIKGIRFFKKLEQLTISNQKNFSGTRDFTPLKKLKKLDVSYNSNLSSINIKGLKGLSGLIFAGTPLNQLDLSTNTSLHNIVGDWEDNYLSYSNYLFVNNLKKDSIIKWKELGFTKQPKLAPLKYADGSQGYVRTSAKQKSWTKVSQGIKFLSNNYSVSNYQRFGFNQDCGLKTWYYTTDYNSGNVIKADPKKNPYVIRRDMIVWSFNVSDIQLSKNQSKSIKISTFKYPSPTLHAVSIRLVSGKGVVKLSKSGKVTALKKGTAKIAVTVHISSKKAAKEVSAKNNARIGDVGTKIITVKVK